MRMNEVEFGLFPEMWQAFGGQMPTPPDLDQMHNLDLNL